MNREHILPQDFELAVHYPGPYPEPRFTEHTLEELYLKVCKDGYEFRHFERIGVDAGAKLSTEGVRECRIEVGLLRFRSRLDIGFGTFKSRLVSLIDTIKMHLEIPVLFAPEIEISAIWPTEHGTDLREVFTPRLVNVHQDQLDALGVEVINTGLHFSCTRHDSEDAHFELELLPDILDPHRLRMSVEAHYHATVNDSKQLDAVLQETFDFLVDHTGRFVETLAVE